MSNIYCYSNKGKVKTNNEDSLIVDSEVFYGDCKSEYDEANILAVFDGVGGESYGELASKFGVNYFKENIDLLTEASNSEINEQLIKCSTFIVNNISNLKQWRFSGTTLAGVIISKKNPNKITVINVGDSRVYFVSEKDITQISYDDSMLNYLIKNGLANKVDKNKFPVNKNIIFNALGNNHYNPDQAHIKTIDLDLYSNKLQYIFIATDGVTDIVDDKTLTKIFTSKKYIEIDKIAKKIISSVEKKGSKDNYSFIIYKKY